MPKSASPNDIHRALTSRSGIKLLDVRESWECEICAIADCVHIPMQEIPNRISELDTTAAWVVVCHHGMRSWHVAQYLERSGFSDVTNLEGGIDAWAKTVEPDMEVY